MSMLFNTVTISYLNVNINYLNSKVSSHLRNAPQSRVANSLHDRGCRREWFAHCTEEILAGKAMLGLYTKAHFP